MWQKGVICDTSSVTCVHLWHGLLNMWRFYTLIYLIFYRSTRPVYFYCCFCLEQPRGRVAKHKRTAVWRHWRSLWLWWEMRWKVRNLEYFVAIFSSKNGVVCGTGARRNRHIWVDQSHCRETVQVRALSYSCSDAFCTQSCAGSFAETVSSIRTARTSAVRSPVVGYVPGWDDYSWSINKIMLEWQNV